MNVHLSTMSTLPEHDISAAIHVAMGACAHDDSDLGTRALNLALDMGATPHECAAIFASEGSPTLLEHCLDMGVSASTLSAPLHPRDLGGHAHAWPTMVEPSLLTRAVLSGDERSCSLLASRGACSLDDASLHHLFSGASSISPPLDGPILHSLLAALGSQNPNPDGAHRLMASLVQLVTKQLRTHRGDRRHVRVLLSSALPVLQRLGALGANPMPDFTTMFSVACWDLSRSSCGPENSSSLRELSKFCQHFSPEGASGRLSACIHAFASTSGGFASSLPESCTVDALRESALLNALACDSQAPATEAILMACLYKINDPSLISVQNSSQSAYTSHVPPALMASRKSLQWLSSSSSSWRAPTGDSMDRTQALLVQALATSARFYAHGQPPYYDSLSNEAHFWKTTSFRKASPKQKPAQWLAWAMADFAHPRPGAQGAGLPLMAAQLCRSSCPELRHTFERVALTASALAHPQLSEKDVNSLMESLDLAAHIRTAASVVREMRL